LRFVPYQELELRELEPNPPRAVELDDELDGLDDEKLPLDELEEWLGVLGEIGVRVLLPLEKVRGPVDEDPLLGRLPLNDPPPGIIIGPPDEYEVRGCVTAPELELVPMRGAAAAVCGGRSSGFPHCRQRAPPSAISLIVLQFLHVTKNGVPAGVGAVGVAV